MSEERSENRSQYLKNDFLLLLSCLILTIIGIIFVVSSHINSSLTATQETFKSLIKEIALFGFSLVTMVIANKVFNYRRFKKYTYIFCTFVVLGLLVACLGFGSINNAKAWIHFGSLFSLQPSEFAKVLMILLIATMTDQPENKTTWQIIRFPFIIVIIFGLIIMFGQNDTGSAIVLAALSLFTVLIPGDSRLKKFRKVMFTILILGLGLFIYISLPIGEDLIKKLPLLREYQKMRFITCYDPFEYFYDAGYQVCNSLIAFARGSLTGVGLGNSVQKFGYLPYAESDFIIAVIAEEGGFIMLFVIFILYAIIIGKLMYYAIATSKQSEKVILFGSAALLIIHILLNVGGATATIPLTGVPLIMLSAGGSSLLAWYALLGIDLKIISSYRGRKK